MADYPEMYKTLFQAMTQAIDILQEAQRKTEEMYISAEQPNIVVIKSGEIEQTQAISQSADV